MKISRIDEYIRERWLFLTEGFSGSQYHNELFMAIRQSYCTKDRYYHTWQGHIAQMLTQFDEIALQYDDVVKREILCAIFFHDVVMNFSRRDNELKSTIFWLQWAAKLNCGERFRDRVAGHILATQHHRSEDPAGQVFLDLDLSILGASRDLFEKYEDGIRREYHKVPYPLFKVKRIAILNNFLKRERIFFSHSFKNLETKARENIIFSIKSLKG